MNKALLPLVALLSLLAGCATPSGSSAADVWRVDFLYTFEHEPIVVSVNGKQVFSGRITTSDSTGFAKEITLRNDWDLLHLRIEVPATGYVLERTLDARQGRFLGVTKKFDGELALEQQTTEFSH